MSDFNPGLWGLRLRHAAGLPNPPPPSAFEPRRFVLVKVAGPHPYRWRATSEHDDLFFNAPDDAAARHLIRTLYARATFSDELPMPQGSLAAREWFYDVRWSDDGQTWSPWMRLPCLPAIALDRPHAHVEIVLVTADGTPVFPKGASK
jgi:hypothetical protein